MAQRYKSFEELAGAQHEEPEATESGAPGVARLWVQAAVAPNAEGSVGGECRSMVLEWLQDTLSEPLPRRALRHRPFSHGELGVSCRAVRVRDAGRDEWALWVARSPGLSMQVVTSVSVVKAAPGHSPVIGLEVHDRSVVARDAVAAYPSELVARVAGRVPLLQNGRPLVGDPIVLDGKERMDSFLRMLVDPKRDMPFMAVSVPTDEPDVGRPQRLWESLARDLVGLAVVWVLPLEMTYRLSDTVGKARSVFLGAWRLYRSGFNDRSDMMDHPLVLWQHLTDGRDVRRATTMFRQVAARDRLRFGHGDRDTLGFDAIAGKAKESGPARLVSFFRNLGRGATLAPVEPATSPDQPERRDPDRNVRMVTGDQVGATPKRPFSGPEARLQRKLDRSRDTARTWATRYEQAKLRAVAAEQARDAWRKRADQLAELVRLLGGDPDTEIPFPIAWDELAAWCDHSLAGRVALTPMARRELGGAKYLDVGLAARSLLWLGREYRDARLRGGTVQLHGRIRTIDQAVFNLPCGGDSFECTWDGHRCAVDWHLKGGGNTRDPKRCLRIYYAWDDDTKMVVIASMPGHRRNAAS